MNPSSSVPATTGQFALETHFVEISLAMEEFFDANGVARQSGKGMVTR